jgi:sterol desaturase/sphingolipid hydroxylase (fatty acid hydroxylase superfamily)
MTYFFKCCLWPFLLLSSMAILAIGFSRGTETLHFNLSYLWIVACLFAAEKFYCYRDDWRLPDGQTKANFAHTILNKGMVQFFIVIFLSLGWIAPRETTLLSAWPMVLQVTIGLATSELGLYFAHRLAHEWPYLWRFHSVHHSVKRLWIVNTGRFHFVDSITSVAASLPFLLLSGISTDAIIWVSAITAYIGVLTHCNVDLRFGQLSYILNTPELHRWHHSTEPSISNNNYGENLMLWDHLFKTFYLKKDEHVETIGISEHMPSSFIQQLEMPFKWDHYQRYGVKDKVPD